MSGYMKVRSFQILSELYTIFNSYDTLHINPLNAELNPICHLLALLGDATIVVISRLRVKAWDVPSDIGQYLWPAEHRSLLAAS